MHRVCILVLYIRMYFLHRCVCTCTYVFYLCIPLIWSVDQKPWQLIGNILKDKSTADPEIQAEVMTLVNKVCEMNHRVVICM